MDNEMRGLLVLRLIRRSTRFWTDSRDFVEGQLSRVQRNIRHCCRELFFYQQTCPPFRTLRTLFSWNHSLPYREKQSPFKINSYRHFVQTSERDFWLILAISVRSKHQEKQLDLFCQSMRLQDITPQKLIFDCALSFPPGFEGMTQLILNNLQFNHPLITLPSTLLYLNLSRCHSFNQNVDHLQDTTPHLETLILGTQFNQPLDLLPLRLRILKLLHASKFRQSLDHLPSTLKTLQLNTYLYSRPLNHLPLALEKLELGWDYICDSTFSCFPRHLTRLCWNSIFDAILLERYPEGLPPTLTHLYLYHGCQGQLKNLPSSLRRLRILGKYEQGNLDQLPPGLTFLEICGPFNQPVDALPPALKKLSLFYEFNHPLDNLPSGLTTLLLGNQFNHSLNHLPPALTRLTLSGCFDQPLDHLPVNLKILNLRCASKFNQPLSHLPSGLQVLLLPKEYPQSELNDFNLHPLDVLVDLPSQ